MSDPPLIMPYFSTLRHLQKNFDISVSMDELDHGDP